MPQPLVRVRIGRRELNVGKAFAEAKGLTVLDEPTTKRDGSLRAITRVNGRTARKKKTTVSEAATAKQGAGVDSAPDEKENN